MRLLALFLTALLCAPAICHADTLDQQTSGINPNAAGYFGQAFAVAGTGTYSDIGFSFFAYPGSVTPYALGTGYLYSFEFSGAPSQLGDSSPDLLGSAEASGGVYRFDPSVVLAAGHPYWFYEDALLPASAISGQVAAEEFCYAPDATSNFTGYVHRSNNFQVTGTPAAPTSAVTPEPSSLALLGTAVLALAGAARKRFR